MNTITTPEPSEAHPLSGITPAQGSDDWEHPLAGVPFVSKHDPLIPDVTELDNHKVVHGIPIASRYNNPREVGEMTAFCDLLKQRGLSGFVKGVFYDTNSDTCNIELSEPLEASDPAARGIEAAAQETLYQFVWFNDYQQGKPCDEADERMAREAGLMPFVMGTQSAAENGLPKEQETEQGQVQGEQV